MQNGYQDVGSWTYLKSTPVDKMTAAWLYAQFVTSKTVSLKKSILGLTFIRDSDIRHDYFTKNADQYGGLIEFYRRPARVAWTPSGTNVPDYPKMAELWWKNIGAAITGEKNCTSCDGQSGRRHGSVDGGARKSWDESMSTEAQSQDRSEPLPFRQRRSLEKSRK